MSTVSCPVAGTIDQLNQTIASGRLKDPRTRRIAEELHDLMQDIAWGRAGKEHLPAICELIGQLLERYASVSVILLLQSRVIIYCTIIH